MAGRGWWWKGMATVGLVGFVGWGCGGPPPTGELNTSSEFPNNPLPPGGMYEKAPPVGTQQPFYPPTFTAGPQQVTTLGSSDQPPPVQENGVDAGVAPEPDAAVPPPPHNCD